MKPGFAVGDIVPNTASIYFDTNPAIITNTFTTEFTAALANASFGFENFVLYPNPTNSFMVLAHEYVHLQDDKNNFWFKFSYLLPQIIGFLFTNLSVDQLTVVILCMGH
jgi:hypothetical protein